MKILRLYFLSNFVHSSDSTFLRIRISEIVHEINNRNCFHVGSFMGFARRRAAQTLLLPLLFAREPGNAAIVAYTRHSEF